MKVLLHICCAPCLIYPLAQLRERTLEVTGFFYNPNIHPFAEYQNRKEALDSFAKNANVEILYPEYEPTDFFRAIYFKEQVLQRCSICWSIRLKATALLAKQKKYDYFSTTLLVSPYQDHEALKKIGSEIAKREGIKFYYEDFRSGFRQAHHLAKTQGVYCQKYCGCIYSEIERSLKGQR